MTTTTANGSTRKTLATQLDRLDSILDGLADNLNAAVAGAVTVAVEEAVHAAILEVLTNEDLRKRLGVTAAPATPAAVPVAVRLAATACGCWAWLAGAAKGAWDSVTTVARMAGGRLSEAAQSCLSTGRPKALEACAQFGAQARLAWLQLLVLTAVARRYLKQLLVALAVGALIGVTCYLCGREVASVVCAFAGFAGSLLATAVARLRKLLPLLVAHG